MAEWLLRHQLDERGLDGVVVRSAGTLGWGDRGATPHAVEALAERGVVLGDHVATRLRRDLVEGAELVLAMTRIHAGAVVAHDETLWSRTFLPGEIVRLAGVHGPRLPSESIGEWADRLGATREPSLPIGRAQEEISDPAGQGLDVYREVADRLARAVERLGALLDGAEPRR